MLSSTRSTVITHIITYHLLEVRNHGASNKVKEEENIWGDASVSYNGKKLMAAPSAEGAERTKTLGPDVNRTNRRGWKSLPHLKSCLTG